MGYKEYLKEQMLKQKKDYWFTVDDFSKEIKITNTKVLTDAIKFIQSNYEVNFDPIQKGRSEVTGSYKHKELFKKSEKFIVLKFEESQYEKNNFFLSISFNQDHVSQEVLTNKDIKKVLDKNGVPQKKLIGDLGKLREPQPFIQED
tara:strand:- start:1 stop:438 length:438 start_codon:yes stop_codon:yes gene_type:complete